MSQDLIRERLIARSLRLAQVQQRSALTAAAQEAARLYRDGQVDKAQEALNEIFKRDPNHPDGLVLKGVIELDHGMFDAAQDSFEQAISAKHLLPLAHYNLGNVFRETGRHEEAAGSYLAAVEQAPSFYEAWGNLGLTYALQGKDVQALDCLHKAILLKPDYAEALDNLGVILRKQGMLVEAVEQGNKAVISNPGFASGYNNLGLALRDLGQLEAAITNFKRALEISPDLAEAHNNLGLAYLLRGDFKAGWEAYRWRHKIQGGPPAATHLAKPVWTGDALSGRTLYIYPEQGFGDVIQFSRYIPIIANTGARIIYRVSPLLAKLIEQIDGDFEINDEAGPEPSPKDYDVHASLLDLPRLLNTIQSTIPGHCPYIEVDTNFAAHWKSRIGESKTFRIGLIWAGQPQHENDRNRSINPVALKPLADIAGVSLYSLQMGRDGEAAHVFADRITDLTNDIRSFADTAAAMRNLDLIISVDTSAAHLAGAIGCRVWTLLPFLPDWRWQLDRTDSPWYPTMELFRQPSPGDWSAVIENVIMRLQALLE